MKKINVLSLFDGMSCGQIALKKIGVEINHYYASEIDKYAIKICQDNFPQTIQLRDIEKWRDWDIDWSKIDLVQGGSPCQGFSFAGKQLNFDDPRSRLFFVFADIIAHVKKLNPKMKFLLENVRMKKEYQDVISERMGVEPININSSLVSAQNRNRFYWTNIKGVEQPEDKGLILNDILQSEVEERFNLTDKNLKHLDRDFGSKGKEQLGDKKTCTLAAFMGADGGNAPYLKQICSFVKRKNYIQFDKSGKGYNSQQDRVYYKKSKAGTIARGAASITNLLLQDKDNYFVYRKITPVECERLQTIPDNFTKGVSNSQRYKMIGNGWTVDVIAHIYNNLNK